MGGVNSFSHSPLPSKTITDKFPVFSYMNPPNVDNKHASKLNQPQSILRKSSKSSLDQCFLILTNFHKFGGTAGISIGVSKGNDNCRDA